jgi:transcriptional regulator with XRE-family HTH domain
MTTKKKQLQKLGASSASPESKIFTHPMLDYSGHTIEQGDESWRKWKVKPNLVPMVENWQAGETDIPKRIAYCRGQLDNLSVEALARYTKNFDESGISRMSIIRYESGESLPGARELRILCDALWVPPNWLLTGLVDAGNQSHADSELTNAIRAFVLDTMNMGITGGGLGDITKKAAQDLIEQRQKWLDEARKSKPR